MNKSISKHFGKLLAGFGLVGLIASFWQTAEKINFLKNPDDPLSCNLNPIVDCGTVLNHQLSSVFGPPNSLIGVVMFSAIVLLGLLLIFRVKPNLQMKRVILFLTTALFAFSVWFYAVSLYEIGKICIFCIFIWVSAIPMFFYSWAEYGEDIIGKSSNKLAQWKIGILIHRPDRLVVCLYLLAIALFLIQFQDYYF